jgi:glycosyltransferase involved in cell wall biosynthesis
MKPLDDRQANLPGGLAQAWSTEVLAGVSTGLASGLTSALSNGESTAVPARRYGIVVEQLRRSVPGGIGTYARGLLQGLNAQGSDLGADESVLLLASAPKGTTDPLANLGPIWSPLRGLPIGHRLTQRGWDNRFFAVPSGLDVVHATSFAQPPRRVSPKRSERCRTMYVHDLAWHTHPDAYPEAGRIWHERALARAFRETDEFFVPSAATEEALRAASRRPIDVRVIPEGCDHLPQLGAVSDEFAETKTNGTRSQLDESGYLLTVSTREPRKNLSRLLQAYVATRAALKALGLPVPTLRIVGPQGWSNSDGDPTLPAQLPEGVELIGSVSDEELSRQLRGAKGFVYVPLVEGFGLPPLEAMRAGVAVVCSAVPSVVEANPLAACIVDPLSVDAIAEGIVRMLTTAEVRNQLVSAGSALASQRTWLACAAQHLACWRTASL